MTIVLNDRRARYVASGGQTSFDVDFPIDTDADVAVYHKVDLTGIITLLTLTTDYTVTLDGAAPNTADVDLVTGAAVNDIITIEGETSPARDTDFTTGGDFLAGTVNDAEDRQYRIDQERLRDRDRTVVASRVSPDTFDPTLPDVVGEASKFLRLNSAETDLEFAEFSTIGTAVLSDATPAAPTASGASGTSDDISRADHAHPERTDVMTDLVDDTTPQQGGALDTNAFSIHGSEGAPVASVAQPNIWAGDGSTLHITGNTQIDDFTDAPRIGAWAKLIFDGTPQLTSGSGITVVGGTQTMAAGDVAFIYADAVDAFRAFILKAAGTAVKLTPTFTSSNQTVGADSQLDVAHGLGVKPSLIQVSMLCISDNGGYVASTNDEIILPGSIFSGSAGENRGVTVFYDTTNVSIVTGEGVAVVAADTFNTVVLDLTKWKYIVKAWL